MDWWLHWALAIPVVALVVLGLLMEWTIEFDDALYGRLKLLHISVGVIAVAVLVPRLAWRFGRGWPASGQFRTLTALARSTQCLLLLGAAFQAVTGVLSRWTARAYPGYEAASIEVFGWLEIPSPWHLEQPDLNRGLEWFHDFGAQVMLILVGLHVLAAAAHWVRPRLPHSHNRPGDPAEPGMSRSWLASSLAAARTASVSAAVAWSARAPAPSPRGRELGGGTSS